MKRFFFIIILLAVGVGAGFYLARQTSPAHGSANVPQKSSERKVLYYQSAMHPWIKSDKPGRCTICGMELTPVYEGEKGFETSGDVVALNQSMIHVVNVQTVEAQKRAIEKTLRVAGMIDDDATRHRILSAYIDGRVDKLYVNYMGAEVKEGQPLADIYSPTLLQAEREYASLAQKTPVSTNRDLAMSHKQLLSAAGQRLRQLGLSEKQIEQIPQMPAENIHSEILAPIGGTVVVKNVNEGQYVNAGQNLFEIADFSRMWFVFRAYEQDMPWIGIGQKVDVTTPSNPGQTLSGTISFIEPNFDEATRSTKVRVELPNPLVNGRRALLHRLYADGAVHLNAPEALTVPRSAVIETGPEAVVYVEQTAGAYTRTVVKLGRRGDTFVEVLSGLNEGDKVVTNGNLLIDGQAEMNRSFSEAPASTNMMSTNTMPLTAAQKQVVSAFVKSADAMAEALSKDDLATYNKAATDAMPVTDSFIEALKDRTELEDILKHLSEARGVANAPDLPAARKRFHPHANAAASVLGTLQKESNELPLQIFECPMVDRAIPGMPKKGRWVQAAGRDIGNPYFGKEMQDCGTKVNP